jgi:hypothetical protein
MQEDDAGRKIERTLVPNFRLALLAPTTAKCGCAEKDFFDAGWRCRYGAAKDAGKKREAAHASRGY